MCLPRKSSDAGPIFCTKNNYLLSWSIVVMAAWTSGEVFTPFFVCWRARVGDWHWLKVFHVVKRFQFCCHFSVICCLFFIIIIIIIICWLIYEYLFLAKFANVCQSSCVPRNVIICKYFTDRLTYLKWRQDATAHKLAFILQRNVKAKYYMYFILCVCVNGTKFIRPTLDTLQSLQFAQCPHF